MDAFTLDPATMDLLFPVQLSDKDDQDLESIEDWNLNGGLVSDEWTIINIT